MTERYGSGMGPTLTGKPVSGLSDKRHPAEGHTTSSSQVKDLCATCGQPRRDHRPLGFCPEVTP